MRANLRHTSLVLILAISGLAFGAGFSGPAGADPIADAQAQAKAIADQIEANGERISALSEQLDGAQLHLTQAEQAVTDAQTRIDAARHEITRIKGLVNQRAVSVYQRATAGRALDGLDYSDASRLEIRNKYAESEATRDQSLLTQLDRARKQLAEQHATAERARAAAVAERARLEQSKHDVEAANAAQAQLLAQVQGQLQALVAAEQRRRETAAALSAQNRFAPGAPGVPRAPRGTSPGTAPGALPNVPPPSSAAAIAIQFARAQLGKPYVYAAAGPDAYDCSGLTMAAWGAAGVSMPHYSGAQYAMFPHVPLDQLEPGDLVFWGPGGSQHVGLYVGDGLMIHAPHTGDVVKVAAVFGNPVGAVRP